MVFSILGLPDRYTIFLLVKMPARFCVQFKFALYDTFVFNWTGDPPTIDKFAIEGTTKSSFRIKEKVIFYCEAKGTPPLDYVWLCNSVVLCKGQDNQLKVSANLETEGVYQCRVENLFGSKPSKGVEIKVGEYKVLFNLIALLIQYR